MYRIKRKVGEFGFDNSIPIGQAKLLCDTVQGQILDPPPNTQKIKAAEMDAHRFMLAHASQVLSGLPFEFEPVNKQ